MQEWKTYTLKDLSKGKGEYGIGASAIPFDKDKLTYLRITDINDDGTLNKSGLTSVDAVDASKYLLEKNDIVFARTGNSTGRSYFYDGSDGPLVYAGFLIRFRLDDSKVNPRILKYYSHSKPYYDWVQSFDTGGTRGNINAKTYGDMPITLPPRHVQDRIVDILYSLDAKIENNRRINDNLEQQAQALYKSWFIDFEPFKDQGVVDSEIGLIPEGWHCTTLSEFLSIKYGKDHKKLSEGIIPVYGSGGLMRYVDTKLHEGEAVLIPRKGSLNNVLYVNEAFWTVDTMFYSIPKQEDSCIYTYLFLANKDLASMNAGSAVPSMTTDILNNMPITEPPAEVLKQFNNICDVYFSRINQNNIENANLSNQRDTLLPKLMSGELTINEIDC